MSENPAAYPCSGHSSRLIDLGAAGLSGLCIMHCLALPILAGFLPLVGTISDNHLIHQMMALTAVPLSLFAVLLRQKTGRERAFFPLILAGLGFLLLGAFIEAVEDYERLLTVTGAVLIATGHIMRLRRHG
ncbi:MerC domain-containing protein [Parvularcula marina]|uniref:MerC domain-containing protein n=1 Tax=Parvularcula marina TaxID=2292771 RepID=UPI003519683D